ncbi:MAG: ATP-dependent Clp protease proteolytic subunit [Planctomycetota bacterium]|jgi:ATP-dependent Clp protease protease subunit
MDRIETGGRIRAQEEPEEEEEEYPGHKHLTDRLLDSRIILLADPITSELAEDIVAKLLLLDAGDAEAPIDLYINSPGGSVDAGFAIYDMARFITAPVQCICTGLTASAAVVVLMAAAKEHRLSLPNSRFLLHQPSGGVRGSVADVKIEADEILKIRRRINSLIAEGTGQPVEKVEEDTRRNYWMNADEALDYGLISGIVSSRKDLK